MRAQSSATRKAREAAKRKQKLSEVDLDLKFGTVEEAAEDFQGLRAKEEEPEQPALPVEDLGGMAFLVQEARRRKPRRKFAAKKRAVKKHEVDPKQLDMLVRVFAEVWIRTAGMCFC